MKRTLTKLVSMIALMIGLPILAFIVLHIEKYDIRTIDDRFVLGITSPRSTHVIEQ